MPDVALQPSAIAKKHICPLGQSALDVHVTGGASGGASSEASLVVCVVVEQPARKRMRKRTFRV